MTSVQTHAANVQSLPCDWLLYEEMSRTGRFCHVKVVTLVNPLTVALFSGPARLPMDVLHEAESEQPILRSVLFLVVTCMIDIFINICACAICSPVGERVGFGSR